MGLFNRFLSVAAAVCVLVQAGPVGAQSIQTPVDQLREMTRIIQANGTPASDDLGGLVAGSKQCSTTTDTDLRGRQLIAHGKTVERVMSDGKKVFIEENITSFGKRGTYHLSKTFAATLRANVVEITKPSFVVLLERTSSSTEQVESLEEINKAPSSIRQAYYAQDTLKELFADMTRAVYGACLKVEPPSFDHRAGTYDAPAVAGIFPSYTR